MSVNREKVFNGRRSDIVRWGLFRHCLHRRGFICNRIGFDAVTHFVYTAPVEFVIRTGKKWSVFKTIRSRGRVNG